MLEIRNLTKTYRSKTGESVRALDDVSISFPETGMVFILGKSGSGKSTLLNIMGGLDSYDDGEFIIKGKSSKEFASSDFDAYRNTFIGFIFQEYNVLDDFTVGANIALALELQGKKATSDRINEILAQVDLLNYAKRKPNELSGGQKQRVAIARALVKDPQIIMADEPTGALDSNTGKQIFDTLKNLSKEKLVLVVSHDRDFAERYADRIVELADGRIVSDVTKHEKESERLSDGIDKIGGQILRIKRGYRLTDTDLRMINAYLNQAQGDVILSGDNRVNEELRTAAGISERGTTAFFEGTDTDKDYTLKQYDKKDSKFIRSRLPMKNAIRMGSSGLKHKKFRLVMTILLSLLAFAMFGFADTMASYEKVDSAVESIMDSNVKNASVTVSVRRTVSYSDGEEYVTYDRVTLNEEDLKHLQETTGLHFVPVYNGGDLYGYGGFSITSSLQSYSSDSQAYTGMIHGLVSMSEADLATTGFTVTGRLPEKKGEIAITELMYRQFNQYGFQNTSKKESIAAGSVLKTEGDPNSIIGKHIELSSRNGMLGENPTYEIVGVVDTQFDYDRYAAFFPKDNTDGRPEEEGNMLTDMVLAMEIESEMNFGFHGLGFLLEEDIDEISRTMGVMNQNLSTYMYGWNKDSYVTLRKPDPNAEEEEEGDKENSGFSYEFREVAGSSALSSLNVTWVDGVARTQLAPDEIVIPAHVMDMLVPQEFDLDVSEIVNEEAIALFGESVWNGSDSNLIYAERINQLANDRQIDFAEVERLFISVTERIYGVEIPETVSMNEISGYGCFEVLYQRSAEDPMHTVRRYELENLIRGLYATIDVQNGRLWENEEFLELMFNSEYMSKNEKNRWDEMDENEKRNWAKNYYSGDYLYRDDGGAVTNDFGAYSGNDLREMANELFMEISGITAETMAEGLSFEYFENDPMLNHATSVKKYDFKVVGIFQNDRYGSMIVSDTVLADYQAWYETQKPEGMMDYTEIIAPHENGIWSFALAPLAANRSAIEMLVPMHYDETGDLKFQMQNPVIDTLDTFNEFIEVASLIFLYVGIGFAVFSALLLMNFIATSISYKKREIGVLRAVGARSSDVFKIFFSEALIIALINFVLSTAVVIAGIVVTNTWMRNSGIKITLLNYTPRQFFLMLAISVGVALLASFLPVNNIARRKPVDAIKDR